MVSLKDILKRFSIKARPDLEWNYKSGKSFEEQHADLGAFEYSRDGFTYRRGDFVKTLKWCDISNLNVYKADLMTIDEIRMEIVYGDLSFEISEEVPGWYQFVDRTKKQFPSIPGDWEFEIVQPPFATNYRTIYSREKS